MIDKFKNKFINNKIYWKLLSKINNILSYYRKTIYNLKGGLTTQKFNYDISRSIIFKILPKIIKSIILLSIIISSELIIKHFWTNNYYSIPDFVKNIISPFIVHYDIDKISKVIQLLSIIASISGVLLGLFYPVLATIASTTYSKVQSSVRQLLISEPYSQSFIKQLTALTTSSLLIILLMILSYKPNIIVLGFIGFNILRSLFSLITIGMGIFNYFDPSNLMNAITKDLMIYFKEVSYEGFYYNDVNFQAHFKKLSINKLSALKAIIGICTSEKYLRKESFIRTYQHVLGLLAYYKTVKPKIPLGSKWYPERYKHLPFFLADSTAVDISERTDSLITPKTISDYNWVENEIIDYIFNGLNELLNNNETEIISNEALPILSEFSKLLGENVDFDTTKLLLDKLEILIKNIYSKNYNSENESFEGSLKELSLIQYHVEILTNIMLGFFGILRDNPVESITKLLENYDWKSDKDLMASKLLSKLKNRIDEIKKGLNFELKVEGEIITPNWYILQYLAGSYLDLVEQSLDKILTLNEIHITDLSKYFSDKKQRLPLLLLAHIGIHVCWKFGSNLSSLKSIIEGFNRFKIQSGINWKIIDYDKIHERNNTIRKHFKDIIFDNIIYTYKLDWKEEYPDIFGESYKVISREINDLLYFNKSEDFKKYFPKYFGIALMAYDKLKEYAKVKGYNPESFLRIICQTIIDLLQLSGLALIYSDLYDNPVYKEECINSWDKLLNNFDNIEEKKFINTLILNYSYFNKPNLYFDALNHRCFDRKRTLEDKFKELKIFRGNPYQPFMTKKIKLEEHKSLLIELIKPGYNDYNLYYDIAEIFIEMYLFSRINSKESITLFSRQFFKEIQHYFNYRFRRDDDEE